MQCLLYSTASGNELGGVYLADFPCSYLLVTWRVESSSPCRRVEDSSVCGSSVWPARTVIRQLVSGTGPCTRVHQYCSGTKLDITEKAMHDIILS